ncbi:MAG TPA: LCP family protein [Patescibacteria group bacterium]|jgi:LCP family protein required for cell wall assembly|nr:LCP family protein [Patescibacteria group bacterium]
MAKSTKSPAKLKVPQVSPFKQYAYAHSAEAADAAVSLPKPARSFPYKKIVLWLVAIILIIGIGGGGWIGYKLYRNEAKITGDKNPLALLGLIHPATLNDSNGRVNILLAGYSIDDPGHQGAALTDSIMVVSLNPTNKSAVLISIPRDMWVDIPGFGYQKINAAYEDGQSENFSQAGFDSGGMGLLEEVIQEDFGITTDYYGLLDYAAFEDAVNAVGGVTVDINSPDPYGLYDPYANLNLPNGVNNLTGQQALDLARARGDGPGAYGFPNGDFNRTQHQQQLLVALKNKATSAGIITNPLKIGSLADAVGNNLKTDMSVGDMETLYLDGKGINNTNISQITLNSINGQNLLSDYTAPDGESALIPAAGFDDYSQIQSVIQSLLPSPKNN